MDVSDAAADVLRAAYYYATAGGHAVVGPALVLVAAARNDKDVALPVLGAAVAGARPTPPADVSRAVETAVPALREAGWWVRRDAGAQPAPAWDPAVADALDRAAEEAGAGPVGVPALLLGLLDPAPPAVSELARGTGLDIAVAVRQLRGQPWAPEEPFTPLTGLLGVTGITDEPYPLLIRWAPALIRWFATRGRRPGPVLVVLELEMLRQAVLTGHPSVRTAHLLLAVVSMQEQLTAIGSGLAAPYRRHNDGGRLLMGRGFDLRRAQRATERLPHEPGEPRSPGFTGKPGDPLWTGAAVAAMERAAAAYRGAGTTHLIAAVLAGADPTAADLLGSLGIDAGALRDELERRGDAGSGDTP